ncbi:hypothetical protein QBC47DRAFT_397953 [Echria macrotheca]|uniref:Uncharacterized protein n=1 Tax=Echria macrotheca TaxID=438768 RepID=A0AAJ0BL70_9PEZI|nr:hypothetical protein QBC47DRAFT_397953 [Echria macrotheca]
MKLTFLALASIAAGAIAAPVSESDALIARQCSILGGIGCKPDPKVSTRSPAPAPGSDAVVARQCSILGGVGCGRDPKVATESS